MTEDDNRAFLSENITENDRISVIVPVYNAEKYLKRCLISLSAQSYRNLEIIIVDDGSKDASGTLCDEFAKKDSRICCIHKENGGAATARNCALDRITGQYVTFVDADDYVAKDYIEVLYRSMQRNKADMVKCRRQCVYDASYEEKIIGEGNEKVYNTEEAVKIGLTVRITPTVWGALYRSEMFRTIRFPEGNIYEDLAIIFDLLCAERKMVLLDVPLYFYMIHSESVMKQEFSQKQAVEIDIIDSAMKKVEELFPEYAKLANGRRVFSYFVVLRRILIGKNAGKYKELRKQIKRKIKVTSKGLLFDKEIPRGIRLKILIYKFGEKPYFICQKISDLRDPELRTRI